MKPRNEDALMVKQWIRPLGFGVVAGAIGCLLMLLLMAALLLAQDVPQTAVSPLALVAVATGAFVGGFTSARLAGQNGWLMGLLCGLMLFVLLLLVGGFALLDDPSGSQFLLKLAIVLVTAAVGGIVAVNVGKRR